MDLVDEILGFIGMPSARYNYSATVTTYHVEKPRFPGAGDQGQLGGFVCMTSLGGWSDEERGGEVVAKDRRPSEEKLSSPSRLLRRNGSLRELQVADVSEAEAIKPELLPDVEIRLVSFMHVISTTSIGEAHLRDLHISSRAAVRYSA
jgi:hypothetical protein